MTLSMSKRKPNSSFVVRKYLLFTGKLDLYSDYKFYRGSCLICLIRSYGMEWIWITHCLRTRADQTRALPVNYKSVLQLEQKNYVRPLEFGGAKSFIFRGLGGLAPPSPYVEPPLGPSPIDPYSCLLVFPLVLVNYNYPVLMLGLITFMVVVMVIHVPTLTHDLSNAMKHGYLIYLKIKLKIVE